MNCTTDLLKKALEHLHAQSYNWFIDSDKYITLYNSVLTVGNIK